jgi:hypothetical protein
MQDDFCNTICQERTLMVPISVSKTASGKVIASTQRASILATRKPKLELDPTYENQAREAERMS